MSEILHGACAERSPSIQNDMPIEFFSTLLVVAGYDTVSVIKFKNYTHNG